MGFQNGGPVNVFLRIFSFEILMLIFFCAENFHNNFCPSKNELK